MEAPYLPNGGPACDATAMIDLWPHQRKVVEEAAQAWPDGRLLCDEVGMGKTIEAILILRRLMTGRGVKRALILLPAGLVKQWQTEFREKGGMIFPRLEGTNFLFWPDDRQTRVNGLEEALEQDVLLMSRETARTENNLSIILAATPWDLVILDESHAARRRKQEEGEFNSGNLLLDLLRQLQLRKKTRGFLFMSATPMQTHPWEPWDLLSILGEGGSWLAGFSPIREYYHTVEAIRRGTCSLEMARKAAVLIEADPEFPNLEEITAGTDPIQLLIKKLAFVPPTRREATATWLRQGSPLARRMYRNTRQTLKAYYSKGLLTEPPPIRNVHDLTYDYEDPAERQVYNSIRGYIEKRFQELEREKPGKGFVMTVYRRRATSSPQALERSLERRRDGLRRVAERKAYDYDLDLKDIPENIESDDLPEGETSSKISSALPQNPRIAREELNEVEQILERLRDLGGKDTKRDIFFNILRKVTEDGRPILIFTEYVDTLDYLRDNLVDHYGKTLGCYSGDGGQRWEIGNWTSVSKGAITQALKAGELKAMICTDAASEGLNLQSAGAVINYDLPWNPSKVEQRIGRIDRIGQKYPEVAVVNLFLKDSVDDRVYSALRERCGLFQHFVGAMQPVLARARKMLLSLEKADLESLNAFADQLDQDILAEETYLESPAQDSKSLEVSLNRRQIEQSLKVFNGDFGLKAQKKSDPEKYSISAPGLSRIYYSNRIDSLESDRTIRPLSPFDSHLKTITNSLSQTGEHLPLVIASYQKGAFRCSIAYWVGEMGSIRIESVEQLNKHLQAWDGKFPDIEKWMEVERKAQKEAKKKVEADFDRALEREKQGIKRQLSAAKLRLQKELGRYLFCLDPDLADLNEMFHQQISRDISMATRFKQAYEKLGGYPEWSSDLEKELKAYVLDLTDNQRQARLIGKELDAALEDPRWIALPSK